MDYGKSLCWSPESQLNLHQLSRKRCRRVIFLLSVEARDLSSFLEFVKLISRREWGDVECEY